MVRITVDVPDELEREARMLKIELSILAAKMLKEKLNELNEIERFKKIVAKSKATEEDAEELSDMINNSMWEYHKKKYNL